MTIKDGPTLQAFAEVNGYGEAFDTVKREAAKAATKWEKVSVWSYCGLIGLSALLAGAAIALFLWGVGKDGKASRFERLATEYRARLLENKIDPDPENWGRPR